MSDVFLSYTAADKGFAEALRAELQQKGVSVTDGALRLGDSLAYRIQQGLKEGNNYAVLVLSRAFFNKRWPRADLDTVATLGQPYGGQSKLLPVWFEIEQADIALFSPSLADKVGAQVHSPADLPAAVMEIVEVVGPKPELMQGGSVLTGSGYNPGYSNVQKPAVGSTVNDLVRLRDLINHSFSSSELQDICFALDIDYENLPGEGKAAKVRELIGYTQRRGQLTELVALLQKQRPHVNWYS